MLIHNLKEQLMNLLKVVFTLLFISAPVMHAMENNEQELLLFIDNEQSEHVVDKSIICKISPFIKELTTVQLEDCKNNTFEFSSLNRSTLDFLIKAVKEMHVREKTLSLKNGTQLACYPFAAIKKPIKKLLKKCQSELDTCMSIASMLEIEPLMQCVAHRMAKINYKKKSSETTVALPNVYDEETSDGETSDDETSDDEMQAMVDYHTQLLERDIKHLPITDAILNEKLDVSESKYLKVQNSKITTLAGFDTLCSGIDLQNVTLSSNYIVSIPPRLFINASMIKDLNLQDNMLKELSVDTFKGLVNLSSLVLSLNELSSLPIGLFDSLPNIQTIDLGNNKIQAIEPGLFSGLKKLRDIKLYHNQITTLDANTFSELPSLDWLSLNGNRFTTLNAEAFNFSNATIDLRYNPMKQDKIETLRAGLTHSNVKIHEG